MSKCEFCDLPDHPEEPAAHVIYMAAEDFDYLTSRIAEDES